MTSQFDLTRLYDVIIRNSVFQLGLVTRNFQIPIKTVCLLNQIGVLIEEK